MYTEIFVETRKYKRVGERKDRLKVQVKMNDCLLYEAESAPYGMSYIDVNNYIEDRLKQLRLAVSRSHVDVEIVRVEV